MSRKVVSYTGGTLTDPNRPCYSWWDYVMARRNICDPGLFRSRGIVPGLPGFGGFPPLILPGGGQELITFFPLFNFTDT